MYIAGVDGGGSKTLAVVTDEDGRVLGSGKAGCGNHQMIGAEAAVAQLRQALHAALGQAGLAEEQLAFVQFGLAGADRRFDLDRLYPEISRQLGRLREWNVVCDTMEGLRCGSPSHTGVVLVCGSNTNAAGRNRMGQEVQVGGFNELYGDRAGGYYLAAQAFGRAIRSWEGREPYSALVDKIPAFLGFPDMGALVEKCLDDEIDRAPIELSLVVHEAAAEGDWLSIRLLEDMGKELGIAAAAVIRKLGGFPGETVPVVLTGSILQSGRSPILLTALSRELEAAGANFRLVLPGLPPVFGSVLLAMDRLGIEADEKTIANFERFGGTRI
jgi:N-acetylglucosamine kinase-like BadF-type ATPase